MRKPTTTSIENDVPIHISSVARATCATPHPPQNGPGRRQSQLSGARATAHLTCMLTRDHAQHAQARAREQRHVSTPRFARAQKSHHVALPLRSSNAHRMLVHFLFEREPPRLVRQHGVKRPATDTRHMGGRPPTVCSISQIGRGLGLFGLGGSPLDPQLPCFWS